MAAITRLTIERPLDADPKRPASTFYHSPFLVNATSDIMPTKHEKGEYFCVSFQEVFDVVFCNTPLFCSNRLKFGLVFFDVFSSLVQFYIDFKAIDSTTRLDRSALHSAVLGGRVVKHLASFSATTAHRAPPRRPSVQLPARSSSTRSNRTP